MNCKKCKMQISGDCMLDNDICVFCYYGIDSWDSNGFLITKQEATLDWCFHCHRKIPNESWRTSEGCKWCDIEWNKRSKNDKTNNK